MADDSVQQFVGITGATDQTARQYLERSQGDLQEAVENFYASGGQESNTAINSVPAGSQLASPAGASAPARGRSRHSGRGQSGNIRGFADILREEESAEEEDEDNEYYAGGAKRFAQAIEH